MTESDINLSPELIVRQAEPFNAEAPLSQLIRSFLTPNPLFYVRNHGAVPEIDEFSYRLHIDGLVQRELSLSLQELKTLFPRRTVIAVLQCAGNRREELIAQAPVPGEIPWGPGAVGTAEWSGVPLHAVLAAAAPTSEGRHIDLSGLDEIVKDGQSTSFGGSIPLAKALSPEVLLAYEMNGAALPTLHGGPLRLVVPGYIGARSVKWLGRISVQPVPSENYFYVKAYRLFAPYVENKNLDPGQGIPLGELNVNSLIAWPADGQTVKIQNGSVRVRGLAVAGQGRRVERVDLTLDGGQSWLPTSLEDETPANDWAWRFWSASLKLAPGEHTLSVRAWDSAANTQPEQGAWNVKGYANNGWHRLRIVVSAP